MDTLGKPVAWSCLFLRKRLRVFLGVSLMMNLVLVRVLRVEVLRFWRVR